jgi:hypothetical protein
VSPRAFAALLLFAALQPKAQVPSEPPRMLMAVGTQRYMVTLEDNPTAQALAKMLPVTFEMTDLNDNEKKVNLPRGLPTNVVRPGIIRAGDLMLWGDDTLVVFYKTFDSAYSYTRIGRIDDPTNLAKALGPSDARVSFSRP